MRTSIFLSHNWNDKPFVRRLADDLRLAGATVWLDEAEIKLGDSLLAKIAQGIDEATYLGVVLSPDSVQSNWVQRELEIALNEEIEGKKVKALPLLYRDCKMPSFLSGKLYADFREEANYSQALSLILDRLDLQKDDTITTIPNWLTGTWKGTWQWKGKRRDAELRISGTKTQPSMIVVSYYKLGVRSVVEQQLQVEVEANRVKLTGTGYYFLEKGKAVGWHLDTFELEAEENKKQLKGTKQDKRLKPVDIVFTR